MDSGTIAPTPNSDRLPRRRTPSDSKNDRASAASPLLVAVDMSEDSRAALVWALEHAASAGMPVTVLHAVHDPAAAPGTYSRQASDPLAPMADTAETMLLEFLADVEANHPELERLADAHTTVVEGLPAQTIVDEAMRNNARLIVMGSRGQTGLPKLLNGSTSQRVVQLSPIPVTVVKANRK
ncbi:MAG: universal stress protein [Alphaproteobacteria bacterium]|nr:universal stress protein [Alphaproteobacteria bacterium]